MNQKTEVNSGMFSTLVDRIKILFGFKKIKERPNLMSSEAVNDRNQAIRKLRQDTGMDLEKGNCPSCGAKFVVLEECSVCNKKACVDCLDYNPIEHKYYCEECSIHWGVDIDEH